MTRRQEDVLCAVIETYISMPAAISSNYIQREWLPSFSSATIRNEMLILENEGFLAKENSSAGRVPTKKGYGCYINNLMSNRFEGDLSVKKKLIKIFEERHNTIDETLDKGVEIISNFLNLPVIITKFEAEEDLLKKIDLISISEHKFIILIITSSPKIHSDEIFIHDINRSKDLPSVVRLLNEYLIDTPINNIANKVKEITPIMRRATHQYEMFYEEIISKIVQNIVKQPKIHSTIYNSKSLFFQPEVQKQTISLKDVFYLLENYSTFSQMDHHYLKTGKTQINLNNNIEGISIVSTRLNSDRAISIVGPTRMNYRVIKYLLEFISEKLISLIKS